jgi:hypothetical protein
MASRGRKSSGDPEREAATERRLEALEDRVRILEARVRDLARAKIEGATPPTGQRAAARTRPRPRCPGCTLELPKGRRGDSCVWCGFVFSAVGRRSLR